MSNKTKHPVLDHGIISYFLIGFLALMSVSICGTIAGTVAVIAFSETYEDAATGLGTAACTLVLSFLFWLCFCKEGYKGILKGNKIGWAFLMLLPFLVVHYTGSVVSWTEFGFAGNIVLSLLAALSPGFGEEIAFRGLGVANFMRNAKSGKSIKIIFWLSSVVFGLTHILNITAGGDVFASTIQSFYAIGVGMLFCAVFLRTGSLWPSIIAHTTVDFMEFMRGDLAQSGGVMVGLGVGDWITIAASGLAVVIALILMNKKHDEEIIALWSKKWGQ